MVIHLTAVFADVLLINQTSNMLQNLCLVFAMLGDLKLVKQPGVYTIALHGFQSIKATIKVLPLSYCLSPVIDLSFCKGTFNRNRCEDTLISAFKRLRWVTSWVMSTSTAKHGGYHFHLEIISQ